MKVEAVVLKANQIGPLGVKFSEESLREIAEKTEGTRYEDGSLIVTYESNSDA
jgi:hypothetical protein